MMQIELKGRNFELDDRVRDYVEEKLGGLERYLPRRAREVVAAMVVLEDDPNGREDNRYVCDAVLAVPGATLVAREGTVSVYAAVDIVEAKLRAQCTKYKEKHQTEPRRERMEAKLAAEVNGEEPAD